VNGNVKLGRAAARSGEWTQHFSNVSCFYSLSIYRESVVQKVVKQYGKTKYNQSEMEFEP